MQIKINNETQINIPKLIQSRMAILANSGGGKSWAVRRLVEQAADNVQVIILDPEGEFASLREKHDFVLCGKDQDVPVEVRSAAKLAEMLLEAKTSAVVDLYELSLQDRKKFVRIFCETMVAVPKKLYHPCLVILDEAHDYVPEGKPSEASGAVEALASKGRKREFALILASQRISKVSKDALSECNNVMIGRATWAIDRKRAAEELGLTDKEEILSLKKMKPGEFYITGPAVSDDLLRITVGEVKTSHGSNTYSDAKPVPPSSALKKALAMLKNLPQEAEKEARTIDELKAEIRKLRAHQCPKQAASSEDTGRAVTIALEKCNRAWRSHLNDISKSVDKVKALSKSIVSVVDAWPKMEVVSADKPTVHTQNIPAPVTERPKADREDWIQDDGSFRVTGSHQKVLDAVAWINRLGIEHPTKIAVALIAGYSPSSSGYMNILGALRSAGHIDYPAGGLVRLTDRGQSAAVHPEFASSAELIDRVMARLKPSEQKILQPLIDAHPSDLSSEELAEKSGYSATSSGFMNLKGKLRSLGLIDYPQAGRVRAADILFK